jgi:hydrogenase nickel incorporation protein HypB
MVKARENAQKVHPGMEIIEVSCLTGEGLPKWQSWLESRIAASAKVVAAS